MMHTRRQARGSMLLEIALSLTLVATVLVAIGQLAIVSARQRQEAEWTGLATREAANLMERAMIQSWEETTSEGLSHLSISPECARRLRSATLQINVTNVDGESLEKEIQIVLQWQNKVGMVATPVSLSAWKFAPGGLQ